MTALFIIDGLPLEDRRAKEALRIAAGIGVWGKVRPTLCFTRAGGLFTRAPEDPDGLLRHTDEAGLAKLINDTDTLLRF